MPIVPFSKMPEPEADQGTDPNSSHFIMAAAQIRELGLQETRPQNDPKATFESLKSWERNFEMGQEFSDFGKLEDRKPMPKSFEIGHRRSRSKGTKGEPWEVTPELQDAVDSYRTVPNAEAAGKINEELNKLMKRKPGSKSFLHTDEDI